MPFVLFLYHHWRFCLDLYPFVTNGFKTQYVFCIQFCIWRWVSMQLGILLTLVSGLLCLWKCFLKSWILRLVTLTGYDCQSHPVCASSLVTGHLISESNLITRSNWVGVGGVGARGIWLRAGGGRRRRRVKEKEEEEGEGGGGREAPRDGRGEEDHEQRAINYSTSTTTAVSDLGLLAPSFSSMSTKHQVPNTRNTKHQEYEHQAPSTKRYEHWAPNTKTMIILAMLSAVFALIISFTLVNFVKASSAVATRPHLCDDI